MTKLRDEAEVGYWTERLVEEAVQYGHAAAFHVRYQQGAVVLLNAENNRLQEAAHTLEIQRIAVDLVRSMAFPAAPPDLDALTKGLRQDAARLRETAQARADMADAVDRARGIHVPQGTSLSEQLYAAWTRLAESEPELRAAGAHAEDLAAATGALKDVLLALGLDWDPDRVAYVLRPRPAREGA